MRRADRPLDVAPATAQDYRELARRRLPRQLFDYVDGGAYDEVTMRSNVADLQRVLLRQVVMRDVSVRETAVTVLGQELALPLILAPVGLGGMLAPRAEVQAARAAERAGIPFIESTVSIASVEEVAKATTQPPWFQLYVMRDRGYAQELMARAQAVGAPVLVLSNHGGRQLDAVPSTTRALPAVADAVGDEVEVLADGGVRTGLDVVKMVAMGARAVLIGRAWAWAVAARGQAGVRHVIAVMKADMDTALGLTGQTSIADVDRSALYDGGKLLTEADA